VKFKTDLEEFGLIPEFIGKFPTIYPLFELTEFVVDPRAYSFSSNI